MVEAAFKRDWGKLCIKGLVFGEAADSEDAETDNAPLSVHSFHHRVVFGFLHVARSIRELDFEITSWNWA